MTNEYRIGEDLALIRDFFDLPLDELAKIIGVNKKTLSRLEDNETYPRDELIDKIYNFCFDQGLKLNLQKEMFYKDDIKREHILLTHASKNKIEGKISINAGKANNDFGRGFYCGDSYEKSISFVSRFPDSCVYFIDFDPDGLKRITFEVDRNWMLAIAYFRGRFQKYENSEYVKRIIAPILEADYLIAPIADNRMFQIIDTFIDGEITDEQCKHCLAATNLGKQYVFLTEKSIEQLKIIERCFVPTNEKEYYKKQQLEYQKIGFDKSRIARIQYKGKGKYIEEII